MHFILEYSCVDELYRIAGGLNQPHQSNTLKLEEMFVGAFFLKLHSDLIIYFLNGIFHHSFPPLCLVFTRQHQQC